MDLRREYEGFCQDTALDGILGHDNLVELTLAILNAPEWEGRGLIARSIESRLWQANEEILSSIVEDNWPMRDHLVYELRQQAIAAIKAISGI